VPHYSDPLATTMREAFVGHATCKTRAPEARIYPPVTMSYDVCLEVRGEITRTVLCCIVYWSCAQS